MHRYDSLDSILSVTRSRSSQLDRWHLAVHTWNCRHIANAAIMKELQTILANFDCEIPTICTPEELFGE